MGVLQYLYRKYGKDAWHPADDYVAALKSKMILVWFVRSFLPKFSFEIISVEEAAELSSLKPKLDELGVPLHAVVKEDVGTEIQDFKLRYFNGEIFVDHKRVFYGPKYRRMGLGLGLARLGVLQNLVYAHKKGYQGNRNGEGFILGGLYVIGVEKQGVLLEQREKEFGDKADLSSILEAAKKINKRQ
ncbi:Redox-regulatory protein FAM213A [Larimichthys crocea]|uniref:Uncharacterized protein n=1 Tax=Larimichthys crocea TaxID=215358 RepID=A0ACD3RS70_LARCR|nr:Redox-regulatory protein FAM213A [Larimichthys crocea]